MAMLDYLPTPQVDVLAYIRRRQAIPARYHASIAALKRRQLIADADSDTAGDYCDYVLTAAGQALFDERDLRDQTAADFTVGDSVEHLVWMTNMNGYTHEWQPAEVVAVGDSRVKICYESRFVFWSVPNRLRKVKAILSPPHV